MINFFRNLFDTEGFPPRWECGTWTAGHGWLHIISDSLIFGAYFAIPLTLLYFLRKKRQQIPFPGIVALFGTFILACGFTHLIDATMFYYPQYRLLGVVKLITAIVSWATVVTLFSILPKALKLPGMSDMNRKLQRRNSALNRISQMLKNRNSDLSSFAAVVSHDIKTPISSSLMFASLAREASEKGKTEDCERMLKELENTLLSTSRMVDEVHDFAKLGDDKLEIENVKTNTVFDTVKNSLAGLVSETNAGIILPENPPVVRGNETALVRVFTNLIQNGIKYASPDRAPVITVRVEPKLDHEEDDHVIFSISDNGMGIVEEDLEKIFEPFTRVKRRDEIEGSGLGLAVCRRILDRLDGGITVSSEWGKGSTFFIELPKAEKS